MDINLELYKTFYSVAKNKSMTKAAVELSVSQPAVTKAIKNLEEQLNGVLLSRSNKGIELTAEGKMLFDKISVAFNIFSEAEDIFHNYETLKKGEIKIGISAVLSKILIIDIIKDFSIKYPDVSILIKNGLTSDLLFDLDKGKLDFVIFNDGKTISNDIKIQKLTELKYNFALHKELDDDNIFSKYPLILQKEESFTRKYLDSFLLENKIKYISGITVVSQDLACEWASQKLGICFAFEDLIKLKHKELKIISGFPDISTNIFLATNRLSVQTKASKTIIDMINSKYIN